MRGVAYILVNLLIVFTILPIIYLIGGYLVNSVYNSVYKDELASPLAKQVLDAARLHWDYFFIIAFFIALIWAVVASQRREGWYEEE